MKYHFAIFAALAMVPKASAQNVAESVRAAHYAATAAAGVTNPGRLTVAWGPRTTGGQVSIPPMDSAFLREIWSITALPPSAFASSAFRGHGTNAHNIVIVERGLAAPAPARTNLTGNSGPLNGASPVIVLHRPSAAGPAITIQQFTFEVFP